MAKVSARAKAGSFLDLLRIQSEAMLICPVSSPLKNILDDFTHVLPAGITAYLLWPIILLFGYRVKVGGDGYPL